MNVRRQKVRIIEGTDTDEMNPVKQATEIIIAPERHLAFPTAGDLLALAAWGGHHDIGNLAGKYLNAVCLNQGIDGKGSA